MERTPVVIQDDKPGSRVFVTLEWVCSEDDVADQLDRSIAEIHTALAYYHDNPEEMRALRRERKALEAELEATALQPPEPVQ